jgi:hypothetical protein
MLFTGVVLEKNHHQCMGGELAVRYMLAEHFVQKTGTFWNLGNETDHKT